MSNIHEKGSVAVGEAQAITGLIHQLDLNLTYVPVQGLVARGRKTRTHTKAQIDGLATVIKELGFLVPIIIDESGKILAGNARVEAARLVGLATIPAVTVAHLSEAQKRLFAIADNRMAELAGWDKEALTIELQELRDLDLTLNIELTGFTNAQIDNLVASQGAEDPRADKVRLASLPAVSQEGDLWHLGEHRLICGDATDPHILESVLAGEQVRTIFGDPPYNLKVDGQVIRSKGHREFVMGSGEMTDDEFTGFLGKVWGTAERALMPGGLAYMAMDWRHARHILMAMEGRELDLLNLIVWNKTTFGMGGFYRSQHELIFLAKKRGGEHTNQLKGQSGRTRSNVWTYPGVQGFGAAKAKMRELHPTVKPVAMVRDALLDSSNTGDAVLDPFSGSGTTIIAAEVSRRKGRAIELDPVYVDTGIIRWQDFTGRQAVLAATGETFSQVRVRRAQTPVQPIALTAPGTHEGTSAEDLCGSKGAV